MTTILGNAIATEAIRWYERDCRETRAQGGGCVDEIHVAYNGLVNREAWCAKFGYVCVDGACRLLAVRNTLPKTTGAALMLSRSRGVLPVDLSPNVGSVGYRKSTSPQASGHIMIVISVDAFGIHTIEGNAGDRVAGFRYGWEKIRDPRNAFAFIHAETIGGTPAAEPAGSESPDRTLLYVAGAAVAATGLIYANS